MALLRAGSFAQQLMRSDAFLSACPHSLVSDERTRVYISDIQVGFLQVACTIDRIASSTFRVIDLLSAGIEKLPVEMCSANDAEFYLAFKVCSIKLIAHLLTFISFLITL